MIVPAAVFVFAPLTLVGIVCCLYAALHEWREPGSAPRAIAFARKLLWALPLASAFVGLTEWSGYRDWQHLYWAAQLPLLAAFTLSGSVLCELWADAARAGASRARGALAFLAVCIGLAALPLALQLAMPERDPPPRATGEPVARLVELVRWGFGGPVPPSLLPERTDVGRTIGHLPRELTVPLGIALSAAWLWIACCALAFAGRLVRAPRVRRTVLIALPALTWPLFFQDVVRRDYATPVAWNLLWPLSERHEPVWRSEPAVLASFGPVLLAAALAAVALFAALALDRTPPRKS